MLSDAKTVLKFSGEGSHYFHMGRALVDREPAFRDSMLRLDAMVRDLFGASVVEMIYADAHRKEDLFSRTSLTHPAIFIVECSVAQLLIDAGIASDLTLGASLGSFAAAVVAGFIGTEDALPAVIRHTAAVERNCEPGGMLAVLTDSALYAQLAQGRNVALAGVNYSSPFVISARESALTEIEAVLINADIADQRLAVSYAFHPQWIDAATASFDAFMSAIRIEQARLPLLCCARVRTLSALPDGYFWSVTRKPARFRDAISSLDPEDRYHFIDVAPAGTLAMFLKYAIGGAANSIVHPILTPDERDQENLAALVTARRGA